MELESELHLKDGVFIDTTRFYRINGALSQERIYLENIIIEYEREIKRGRQVEESLPGLITSYKSSKKYDWAQIAIIESFKIADIKLD
ncbi:MAG: hypothetical protein AAF616_11325 [Bacteroidota bacterium]